jgi:hypothetical protein
MIVVCVVLAAALVAVVAGFLAFMDRRERAWTSERRELLNRIQHPQRMPVAAPRAPKRRLAEVEPDESHLVGVVQPS